MAKTYLGMRGKTLNYAISIIAGCDFLLFGYGELAATLMSIRATLTASQTKESWAVSSPFPSS